MHTFRSGAASGERSAEHAAASAALATAMDPEFLAADADRRAHDRLRGL
jgi:hypothetical protein